jgi:AraC-like DNA-binding protein
VLPDGCTDFVWEPGRGAFIAGPDTGPVPTTLAAGTIVLGVRFRPGAAGALLGLPLCELRDQRVDFADVQPGLAGRVPGTLEPGEAEAMLVRVTAELAARRVTDPAVMHGARLLAGPRAGTGQVASELGVSTRQLRRRWQADVGYGPKTFQRVMRFRRFVSRLDAAPDLAALDLADLAAQTGYADQAHLTREWRRLAGLPPRRWLAGEQLLGTPAPARRSVQDGGAPSAARWPA